MSLLKTRVLYNNARKFSTTIIRSAYWNKDWKPLPFPKSEEERLAAAKKYGLLPVEYEPTPDDGSGSGDYPHLKPVSAESKDPFYPWDFPEYRRNFGEILHEDQNIYSEDRLNVSVKPRFSTGVQLACLLGTLGLSVILFELAENTAFYPLAKQHMPEPGVKHYTY